MNLQINAFTLAVTRVTEMMALAGRAGATIIKPAQKGSMGRELRPLQRSRRLHLEGLGLLAGY
jgi:hypothetical protein